MEVTDFILADNHVGFFYKTFGAESFNGDYIPDRHCLVKDGAFLGRTPYYDPNVDVLDKTGVGLPLVLFWSTMYVEIIYCHGPPSVNYG